MPYLPLKVQAGLYKNGTRYQARGRWWDAALVRFYQNTVQPVGGWQAIQADTGTSPIASATSDPDATSSENTGFAAVGAASVWQAVAKSAVNDTIYAGASTSMTETVVCAVEMEDIGSLAGAAAVTLLIRSRGLGGWGPTTVSINKTSDGTPLWSSLVPPSPTFSTQTFSVPVADLLGEEANLTVAVGVDNTLPIPSTFDVTWVQLNAYGFAPEDIDLGPSGLDVGVCRALLAWRDGDGTPNLAIGTNEAFLVLVQGDLVDLTPGDLVPGNEDSTSTIGGYGDGPYGLYNYGQGDPTQANLVDADGWQLDTFGNYIVGVLVPSDGRLFYWDGLTSTLTEMDNAPTNNSGIVVTSERFVVALGAGGDPRLLQWASQETLDVWTPSSSNTAGNFPLPGSGRIMCGRRTKNETLIFTDADLFSMQYIGGAFIYSVVPVGRQCGVVSRNAVAMVNDRAIWMGQSNFFAYTGTVRPLPSDVSDYVFSDINQTQSAKIFATTIAEFGEVWWFYPSAASVENDRYVIYNYVEDHWNTGPLTRLAGIDRSVFDYPIMASVTELFSQEQGFDHIDGVTPFLESGPLELGDGDRLQNLTQLIPDEATQQSQTLGALNASIYTTLYPDQAEVLNGPYTLANPTSIRLTARQLRVRAEQIQAGDWRLGVLRLNTQPGSRR